MKHVVSISHTEDFSPQLWLYDPPTEIFSARVLSSSFPVSLQFSSEKVCVGYDDLQGAYHPCPLAAKLKAGTQCRYCASDDALLPCLKCDGSVCLAFPEVREDCKEMQMVVYVAGFGTEVKAGVSQEHRIERRLQEQGADFGAVLFRVKDGKEARRVEADLVRKGARNFLNAKQKTTLLAFDKEAAFSHFQSVASQLLADPSFSSLERFFNGAGTTFPRVLDFTPRYPVFSVVPERTEALQGTIMGSKGSLLFLRQEEAVRVLELNRLVGLHLLGEGGLF